MKVKMMGEDDVWDLKIIASNDLIKDQEMTTIFGEPITIERLAKYFEDYKEPKSGDRRVRTVYETYVGKNGWIVEKEETRDAGYWDSL